MIHDNGTVSYMCWALGQWVWHTTEIPLDHLNALPRMAQVAIVRALGMNVNLDSLARDVRELAEPRVPAPVPPVSPVVLPRIRAAGRPKRVWRKRRRRTPVGADCH